jgi:hypothetical protein
VKSPPRICISVLLALVVAIAVVDYSGLRTNGAGTLPAGGSGTSGTVQADSNMIAQTIRQVLSRADKSALPDKFKPFQLVDATDPLYPSNDQLSRASKGNQALQMYAQFTPERRSKDFYFFEPTGDHYWTVPGPNGAGNVLFRCGFLIHLEASEPVSTEVMIFEYLPVVKRGSKFAVGHKGPGWYENIKGAPVSLVDQKELLTIITNAVQFSEAEKNGPSKR